MSDDLGKGWSLLLSVKVWNGVWGFQFIGFASLFPPPGRVWPEGSSLSVWLTPPPVLLSSQDFQMSSAWLSCLMPAEPRTLLSFFKTFLFQSVLFLLTFRIIYPPTLFIVVFCPSDPSSTREWLVALAQPRGQWLKERCAETPTYIRVCLPVFMWRVIKRETGSTQSKPFYIFAFIFYIF